MGRLPLGEAEPPAPRKEPGTASYHLSPFPRLRPCVAWQGSKEMGDHPATQLRRLCPGDVRASGGSILLVPMIALCTVDLEECVRGATETGELLMSSSSMLRQRDLELYVIINKATWLYINYLLHGTFGHTQSADMAHSIMEQ